MSKKENGRLIREVIENVVTYLAKNQATFANDLSMFVDQFAAIDSSNPFQVVVSALFLTFLP